MNKRRTLVTWPFFLLVCGLYLVWFYQLQKDTGVLQETAYHKAAETLERYSRSVNVAPSVPAIVIASDQPFRATSIWVYVAKTALLPDTYRPQKLARFNTLAHAAESDVRLVPVAGRSLERLFAGAAKDGRPLALSSAYRSITDQKALYDAYRIHYGSVYADKYVAQPGASEHQTGLAIDISDYSVACLRSAAACTLSPATAAWLATEAPKFGFILRYPEDKETSTGIAYEPWHFRYIGKAASALTAAGLTLDDFVKKVNAGS